MNKEKIDKFGIVLPRESYTFNKGNKKYNPHIFASYGKYGCKITVSSRAILEKDELPDISADNIDLYPSIIEQAKNIHIDTNTLLYSPLYWLDICLDVTNDTGLSTKDFISILRERAYQKTMKNEIIVGFDKDKGFECSLTVKSSCKTVKDSLAIYAKIPEIKSNKYHEPNYYNNFSDDFLINNADLVRYERRLQSAAYIKKAYHLEHLPIVTLNDIFNCDKNVVADKVLDIFLN